MLAGMHRDNLHLPLDLRARQLLWACVAFIAMLVVFDLIFNWADVSGDRSIRRIFNLAREESLPTWFASTQAMMVGIAAWATWWVRRNRLPTRKSEAGFLAVGAFFIYVGIDDAAKIHERVGSAVERVVEDTPSLVWIVEAFPSFGWQLFVAPVLALGLLASLVFIGMRGPKLGVWPFVGATLLAFGISQGLDFLEGIDGLFEQLAERNGLDEYTVSHSFKVVEETLEMLGTTAALAAVLRLLVDASGGATIHIDGPAPADVDREITQPFPE
jgi:hypothetical protein